MPTYEYRCPNGHDFEHFFRKISEATAEIACPVCGATAERRVSGGAGLLFKGSGFYLTDYGKNAHRKPGSDAGAAKSESGGDAKSGASSEGASGAKSDASKSETTPKAEPSKSTGGSAAPKKGGDSA